MKYLISYDLIHSKDNDRSDDYRALAKFLSDTWDAKRVLRSQWALEASGTTVSAIRDKIYREHFIEFGDRILVTAVSDKIRVGNEEASGYASYSLKKNGILKQTT